MSIMRKVLLGLLLSLPLVASADNYYIFDGTNDSMRGSFTTTYAPTLTMCAWIRYAAHPAQNDQIITLASAPTTDADSNGIRIASAADTFNVISNDGGTSVATATKTTINNTWVPFCGWFTSATRRDVTISDQTANNTTSRTISSNLNDVVLGELPAGTGDATINMAYVAIWSGATSANVTSFVAGNCPAGIDASNLIGYWDLQASNATQTNSGTDATGDLTVAGATFNSTGGPSITCAAAPTFTAGPTASTITTTTELTTFTLDQTGTVYGVACPDGQSAPTVAQVIAGNCTGGVAAVNAWSEAVVATVGDSHTFTGLVPGTRYDLSFAAHGTSLDSAAIAALANQDITALAFTSGPTEAPATNGFQISYVLNGAGTVYAAWCNPGDAVPSNTELEAGQCGGGNAALKAVNEVAVSGASETLDLTQANLPARADVYVSGTLSGADTSVTSLTDQDRSPRSGFAIVAMSSHSAAGLCNLDSYFTPDCADGDVFEYEDDTNESADCNISIAATGELTLTPVAGGDCDDRRTFEISYQDVSSATTGLFTAPATGNFTTDDTVYINNEAPDCPIQDVNQLVILTEDEAMDTIDLKVLAQCSDAEDDLLAFAVTSGTIPVGTSLGGTGNKDWTGTPSSENEAGATLTITVTDIAGDTTSFQLTVYVINTWVVPDLFGLNVGQANTAVIAAAPWRTDDPGVHVLSTECSDEDPGTIISQDPAAAAAATASEVIDVILAVACGDPATEKKVVFVVSDLTGLVRWVDYIPVAVVPGCEAGRYEENGCWATMPLASDSGKVAWIDYIPVGEVAPDDSGKWRYENNGWIPVDDLTP